ncbi:MAG: hypothetical protein VKK04_07955 [Synechococcales bacterium]|nr:hypothetical protein [Synechococcales bacterium]
MFSKLQTPIGSPPHCSSDDDSSVPGVPPEPIPDELSSLHSLAVLWARKYVTFVKSRKEADQAEAQPQNDIASKSGRDRTAANLQRQLPLASAQAWSKTETLLATELHAHGIDPRLIKPLEIAEDSKQLFMKALDAYADDLAPRRLSVIISGDTGKMRQKYTSEDPRAIGFVSMQFHYTGQILLDSLSEGERSLFSPYLKVMDDHMYMPLRETYMAAANHALDSPVLAAVQHLLPVSSQIAYAVCDKICRVNPNYRSHTGSLRSQAVRVSSIRDVEMFQVYLCLCVLEDSVRSVQRELFPLCVMLYPPLRVEWKLVQDMLQALTWEMADRLSAEDMGILVPYLRLFSDMFSREVFQ